MSNASKQSHRRRPNGKRAKAQTLEVSLARVEARPREGGDLDSDTVCAVAPSKKSKADILFEQKMREEQEEWRRIQAQFRAEEEAKLANDATEKESEESKDDIMRALTCALERITGLEDSMQTLQTRVTELEGERKTLQTRVTQLEGERRK